MRRAWSVFGRSHLGNEAQEALRDDHKRPGASPANLQTSSQIEFVAARKLRAVSYHRSWIRGHMPPTLKAINAELARRGYKARLERGSGYFYFWTGEVTDWLEKTVRVPNVRSLTLEQWIEEFRRLKKLNQEIMRSGKGRRRKGSA